MSAVLNEVTQTLRMAVVGSDYVTNLGLSHLLSAVEFIEICGTASDSQEILALVQEKPVDLVLVDAAMQLGPLASTCRALAKLPDPPTVVVMGNLPFTVAEDLVFDGVSAVLHHGVIAEDLPVVLRMIHRGGALLVSDEAREALMLRHNTYDMGQRVRCDALNAREKAVAKGVAQGLTNAHLAKSLHLSEATIKLLVSNVMNKLGVANRVQIAVAITKAMSR